MLSWRHYYFESNSLGEQMIDAQLVAIISVFLEAIGILFAERRTALWLGLASIMAIIMFFIV